MVLLFHPKSRYKALNTKNLQTDHFNFHVKRLLELELITKGTNGLYELTLKGKEFANRFDDVIVKIEGQPKLTMMILTTKIIKGKTYLLMQKRLKEPLYGYHGVVSGKIRWGETLYEGAKRELLEETGLIGKLELIGIEHKMDYSNDILAEDKFFFIFRAQNLKGRLITNFKGGENKWIELAKVKDLPHLFDDMLDVLKIIDTKRLTFLEKKSSVSGF